MTIADVSEFIYRYRGHGKAFRDWTVDYTLHTIDRCFVDGTICCVERDGKVQGICIAQKDEKNNVMHVLGILTLVKGLVPMFMRYFLSNFPTYTLTALRREKQVTYDVKRLTRHLQVKQGYIYG